MTISWTHPGWGGLALHARLHLGFCLDTSRTAMWLFGLYTQHPSGFSMVQRLRLLLVSAAESLGIPGYNSLRNRQLCIGAGICDLCPPICVLDGPPRARPRHIEYVAWQINLNPMHLRGWLAMCWLGNSMIQRNLHTFKCLGTCADISSLLVLTNVMHCLQTLFRTLETIRRFTARLGWLSAL